MVRGMSAAQIASISEKLRACGKPTGYLSLIERADLQPGAVRVLLDQAALSGSLGCAPERINPAALAFEAPFQMRRRSVELKLHLGAAPPEIAEAGGSKRLVQNMTARPSSRPTFSSASPQGSNPRISPRTFRPRPASPLSGQSRRTVLGALKKLKSANLHRRNRKQRERPEIGPVCAQHRVSSPNAAPQTPGKAPGSPSGSQALKKAGVAGWGGRIRTYDTRYQKPLPYHLATPQRCCANYDGRAPCSSPERRKISGSSRSKRLVIFAHRGLCADYPIQILEDGAQFFRALGALADHNQIGGVG